MITEIHAYVCESCAEIFKPITLPHCPKCQTWHVMCAACQFVHSLTAAQESFYLNGLESDPEFYGK